MKHRTEPSDYIFAIAFLGIVGVLIYALVHTILF